MTEINIEKIKEDLKKNLTEFRYNHSLKVAEMAKSLAKLYHQNEEEAYLIGLIHDIAKDFSDEESEQFIKTHHLPTELLESKYKDIIHADIGAVLAQEQYQIDKDLCQAILFHTIGNKDMNEFDKIIFIADKIARKNLPPPLEKVKELTYQKKLDEALLFCLEAEEKRLTQQGKEMHPNTKILIYTLKKENSR